MTHIKFTVLGMVCSGCKTIIEEATNTLDGVERIRADYRTGQVTVDFDPQKISLGKIQKMIVEKGYSIVKKKVKTQPFWLKFIIAFSLVAILAGVMIGARHLSHYFHIPDVSTQLSEGMIFLVGLISGLHCIGMCGGFVMSYTAKDAKAQRSSWRSHLFYGLGKTTSYAMFGALFGLFGSIISITPFIQGIANLLAGGFLILFGLNMLNLLSIFKYIRLKQPKFIARFAGKQQRRTNNPLLIGFFSGFLLGCGPLQAMYIMAAGGADPLGGAKILALFGLGTLPALFGFGLLLQFFSAKTTQRFFQLSGIILIIVGIMMLNKGLMRTGSSCHMKAVGEKIMHTLRQLPP